MRKPTTVALALVLTLPGLALAAPKAGPTVTCSRFGESVTSVPTGTQITVSGTGYRRDVQLAVCIDSEGCSYPRTDQAGEFVEGRTLYTVGTSAVKVYEVAPNWSAYRPKAQTSITVTE